MFDMITYHVHGTFPSFGFHSIYSIQVGTVIKFTDKRYLVEEIEYCVGRHINLYALEEQDEPDRSDETTIAEAERKARRENLSLVKDS